MKMAVANCCVLVGLGSLAVAGWWVYPAVGVAVLGVSLIAIGVGTARARG